MGQPLLEACDSRAPSWKLFPQKPPMPSSTLLLVRAFGPATALGMLSFLSYAVLAHATTPLLGPALRPPTWVPLGGLVIAAGWYLAGLVRLWRWEAGAIQQPRPGRSRAEAKREILS